MAAKKTAKKPPAKTAKPSFRAPTKAGAVAPAEGEDDDPAFRSFGTTEVPASQLGINKDVHAANREFAKAMNKDGRRRVVMADEAPNVYELRRPTGILALDKDIGGG